MLLKHNQNTTTPQSTLNAKTLIFSVCDPDTPLCEKTTNSITIYLKQWSLSHWKTWSSLYMECYLVCRNSNLSQYWKTEKIFLENVSLKTKKYSIRSHQLFVALPGESNPLSSTSSLSAPLSVSNSKFCNTIHKTFTAILVNNTK